MFFGAGNLIFAPFIATSAGTDTPAALAGMFVTAVICPAAAVCIIAPWKSADNMIRHIWKPLGPIFMSLVYLLIGPCIAIPRTASTAMEMWTWLVPSPSMQTLCIILFFICAFLMALHPGHLKDILGKVLGPLLLALILFLCVPMLIKSPDIASPTADFVNSPFLTGLDDGYQTMDILAAMCFGPVILINIRDAGFRNEGSILMKVAVGAAIMLACVYGLLGISAMCQSAALADCTNGAQVLSQAAASAYGQAGQLLCGILFLTACLNVCSSLLACCSQYFSQYTEKMPYLAWLVLFTAAGTLVACTGLDSILAWSGTVLSWICPVAIIILLVGLGMHLYIERKRQL